MSPKLRRALNEWRSPHSFSSELDTSPIARIEAAFAIALSPDPVLAVESYRHACALVAESLPQGRTIEDLMKDPEHRKTIECISICLSQRRRASALLRKAIPE